ncbi:P-type conjugative transfer protein TrbJ [Sphingomonas oligoaromativorans]|uniref:P-type conjugative transfer protein TrbJ n=1 Tax=Sphingomonas oligoaromativorans TaxID=575322 RepID=UPI001423AF50|nr:P-type conjugative transfer protein TrbJ [Sphingomonas oligoaromativorans]NIJ34963.1 P-type conjugative transfer protein TrbJ [Sphingomonas oligoaromativorans]
MRHIARVALLGLITMPVVTMLRPAPANAIIVFDPSNYAQNLLTAARALQQINNQIQSLQNETTMLANQARNLASVNFPELQQLTADLQQIDRLMGQAQSINFNVGTLDTEFAKLFPGMATQSGGVDQQVSSAQARVTSAMTAYKQTMGLQAQVAANVQSDATALAALSARSQSAVGALQVSQATNQLLALATKQQFQIQQMMAAQYRSQAIDEARRAQSSIDAAAAAKAFLGTGTAYTPR